MPKYDVQMVAVDAAYFPDGPGEVFGSHDLKVLEASSTWEAAEAAMYDYGDEFIITAVYECGEAAPNGWMLVYGDPRFGEPSGPYPDLDEALKHTFDGSEFRIAVPKRGE